MLPIYLTLEALFALKVFKFLPLFFVYVEKRFDLKDNVNFKVYDVTVWETNN